MCFFFFQAEDGIRDIGVTGVQTCALPICRFCATLRRPGSLHPRALLLYAKRSAIPDSSAVEQSAVNRLVAGSNRSEERRVGKSVDLGGRRIIKKKKKEVTVTLYHGYESR